MYDFHHCHLLPVDGSFGVRRGEGREIQKSDARARRHQSTVPVEALHPHADLQAPKHYRGFGVDRDEHDQSHPAGHQ